MKKSKVYMLKFLVGEKKPKFFYNANLAFSALKEYRAMFTDINFDPKLIILIKVYK